MSLTPSTMLALGTRAPDFVLNDTEGNAVSRDSLRGAPGLLVIFLCNHCPYVVHIREPLAAFANEYAQRGLAIVGINSNDVANYPADAPDRMAEERKNVGYTFPYLFDESQEVAKDYQAACTPDFFLFDADQKLVYRGQFDDSRPNNGKPVSGADLRRATDTLFAGQTLTGEQRPSVGCNIKWKPGNEPSYFG